MFNVSINQIAGSQASVLLSHKKIKLEVADDVDGWMKPCWSAS